MSASSAQQDNFSPVVLCGLQNIGNTCYFNAGLQLLVNCQQFISALRFANPLLGPSKNTHPLLRGRFSAQHTRRLLQLTQSTVDELETASQLSVSPRQLLAQLAVVNPQFEGFLQQDCPEMVNSLLASIDDETRMATSTREELDALPNDESVLASRDALVLRLRDEVDVENEKIERMELQRRDGMYKEGSFRPPLLFHSGVGDVYRGYTLSEITCDACKYCSRVIDEFTTLHLEIPTDAQRVDFAKRHPEVERPGKVTRPNKLAWYQKIGAFLSWIFCCCFCCGDSVDYPLTLEECLDIHFDAERLKGSNKYKCGKCGTLGQATKKVSIVQLPEMLLLHNKRFTYGAYWTRKKYDHVIFPAGQAGRGLLDMSPYCTGGLPLPRTTTYELNGVVNHHGSYSGGHYTAYVKKGEHGWVLCNDSRIVRASEEDVADSQEYVLLYQLKSPTPRSESVVNLQIRAQEYLLGTVPLPDQGRRSPRGGDAESGGDVAKHDSGDDTDEVCYMSRLWLFRMSCFCEPGMISNVLPPPGTSRPSFSPSWFFVPVLRRDYAKFVGAFGGSAYISKEVYDRHCAQEADYLRQLRAASV